MALERNIFYRVVFEGIDTAETKFADLVRLSKELKRELGNLPEVGTDEFKNLDKEIRKASDGVTDLGKAIDLANTRARELERTLKNVATAIDQSFTRSSGLAKLQEELKKTQEELKKLEKSVGTGASSKSVQSLTQRVNELESALTKAKKTGSKPIIEDDVIKNLRAQLKLLNNQLLQTFNAGGDTSKLVTQVEQVRSSLEQAQQIARRGLFQPGSLQASRLELRKIDRQLDNLSQGSTAFQKLSRDAAELRDQIRQAELASGRFQRNIGNYPSLGDRLVNVFKRIGTAVLAAWAVEEVIFRVRDAINSVIDTSVEFSGEITKAASIAQRSVRALEDTVDSLDLSVALPVDNFIAFNQQLDQAQQKARDFAAVSTFTATETAQSFTQLARAGFELNDIFEITPQAQSFALAAGESIESATDIIIGAIRTYGEEADFANEVTNTFAATLLNANIDLTDFSESFKQLAPTAAALNIDLQEVSATIGILGDRNLRGSIATTSLKTAFNRLVGDIPAVRREIERLNLNLVDGNGQFVGVANTIEQLEQAYANFSPAARQASLTILAGNRAVNQFNVLLAEGSANINRFAGELRASGLNVADLRAQTQRFLDETNGLQEGIGALGIEVEVNEDGIVNYEQILEQIRGLAGDLGETDRESLITNIFGRENFELINEAIDGNIDAFEGFKDALQDVGNTGQSVVARIANRQLQSLPNQIKLAQSAAEELSLTLGGIVEDPFRELVSGARLLATALSEAIRGTTDVRQLESFQEAVENGFLTPEDLESINSAISGFRDLGTAVSGIVEVFKILGPLLIANRIRTLRQAAANEALQIGTERLSRSQRALLSVGNAVTNVSLRIRGAITALPRAFRRAAQNMDTFRASIARTNAAAGITPGIMGRLSTSVRTLGVGMRTFVSGPLRGFRRGIQGLTTILRNNPIGALITAFQLLSNVFRAVAAQNNEVGRTFRMIGGTIQALMELILQIGVSTINTFSKALLSAADIANGRFGDAAARIRSISDDYAAIREKFLAIETAAIAQQTGEILDKVRGATQDVTIEQIKTLFEDRLEAEGISIKEVTREQFGQLANEVSRELIDQFKQVSKAAGEELGDEGFFGVVDGLEEQLDGVINDGSKVLTTTIALALDQLRTEAKAAFGDGTEGDLDPSGGPLDRAVRQLGLQADRILQRLEDLGVQATERLQDVAVEQLKEQEAFGNLLYEQQVALIQEALGDVVSARQQARRRLLEFDRQDREQAFTEFSRDVGARLALRAQELQTETTQLREALADQLITQEDYNRQLNDIQESYAVDVARIRRNRLEDLLSDLITSGEFDDIANPIRSAIEAQADAIEQASAAERRALQDQYDQSLEQLQELQNERLEIEDRYTQGLIQAEQDRTAALVEAANQIIGAEDTQAVQEVFDLRAQQTERAFATERQALEQRANFLESTLQQINDRRVNLETSLNLELTGLADERASLEAELSTAGADEATIRQRIAAVDRLINIIQTQGEREREILLTQFTDTETTLEQINAERLLIEEGFNQDLARLQEARNLALLAASSVELDTEALTEQFTVRAEIVRDGFETELAAVEENADRLSGSLINLQRRRGELERELTQALSRFNEERAAAIAEFDFDVQGQQGLDALEENLAARRQQILGSFQTDVDLIDSNIQDTEQRLQAALDRRQELDQEYFNAIINTQSDFNRRLLLLQQQAADDLSQEALVDIQAIVSSYQQQAGDLRAELEFITGSEFATFDERTQAREDFVNNLQELIDAESQALSDFAEQTGINFDAQPFVDLFQDRLDTLNRNFQSEVNLLEQRRIEINGLVENINEERVATEQRYQQQLEALADLRGQLAARFGVDGDLNLQDVGGSGPSPTDIPSFLSDDSLELIETLIEERSALIGSGRDQELALLRQKEALLLDAQRDINDAGLALEQDYLTILNQIGQEQLQVLGSAVGVTVDLTDLRNVLNERQQITETAFIEERQALIDQTQVTRTQLINLINERIEVQSELNQRLAASNLELQNAIADAVSEGADESRVDEIRASFLADDQALRDQYARRQDLIIQNEREVRLLYDRLLSSRNDLERDFFAQSAEIFTLGNALINQTIAGALGGADQALVDQTVQIQEQFNLQFSTIQSELTRINTELTERYAERTLIQSNFNQELNDLLAQQDNLLAQAVQRGDSAESLEELQAVFDNQERELRLSFNRRLADTDTAIRNLSGRLENFSRQQSELTGEFAATFQEQNEAFVLSLIDNLEGQDLLDALGGLLNAELDALDNTFALQNRNLEAQIDQQIALQQELTERSIENAQERSDELTRIEEERNALIEQLNLNALLPQIESFEIGNIIEVVGEIPGAADVVQQLLFLEQQAEDTARIYDDANESILAESQRIGQELDALRTQQTNDYDSYLAEIERLTQEQISLLDDLVDRNLLAPEVRAAEEEALRVRNLLAQVRELERQENEARIAGNQAQADELSEQLLLNRAQLQQALASLEGDWLESLNLDYDAALQLSTELTQQYLEEQRKLRDDAITDAAEVLSRTLQETNLDIDEDTLSQLRELAAEIGEEAVDALGVDGLTPQQLEGLRAALGFYQEDLREANEIFLKATEDSLKRTLELTDRITERLRENLDNQLAQRTAEVAATNAAVLANIEQDYLNAVEENRGVNEDLENRRRLRTIVAERNKNRALLEIQRERLEQEFRLTKRTQDETEAFQRQIAELQREIGQLDTDFFETIREDLRGLTLRELRQFRETLVTTFELLGQDELAKLIGDQLAGTLNNAENSFNELADIFGSLQDIVGDLSNGINEVFQIDENIEDSQEKINDLGTQLKDLDEKYLEQIEILERLAGIQRDGLEVADARNVAQRLAAFGVQEALQQEADALKTRYEAEKQFLNNRLREEKERNAEYVRLANILRAAEVAAATAIAVANAAAAVAKASVEGTFVLGIAAAAAITAAVATAGAGITSIIAGANGAGEMGGQPIYFQPLLYEQGGQAFMESGGQPKKVQATRTKMRRRRWGRERTYALSRKRNVKKVPRGRKLKGPSHRRGGILTELEGNEFVMSVPSVSMFLPQLAWMNEQGNRKRAGQPYSSEFPAELFPSSGHTPNTNYTQGVRTPRLVTPIMRGFGRDGGLALPDGITGTVTQDTGEMERKLEIMTEAILENNERVANMEKTIAEKRFGISIFDFEEKQKTKDQIIDRAEQ